MSGGADSTCAIAIFARAPVAGACNTRLVPKLGAAGAADLQKKFILRAIETAYQARVGPVTLWCAPDASHPFFAGCAARFGVTLHAQRGEDLGARMAFAFDRMPGPLLLMGTDCPSITADDLSACASALVQDDAVFLPAEDGGYGLVGLKSPAPGIFSAMAWSTSGVMAQTWDRLRALGLRGREIRTIWDVDEPADYDRLAQSGLMDV